MKSLFATIDRTIELFVAAIFAAMVIVGSWQVFSRFVLNFTPSWSEEVQIFGHIWLVFLAIPIAYRRGAHITVEAIRRVMAPWMTRALDLTIATHSPALHTKLRRPTADPWQQPTCP